jgi:hypothetical protein
VRAFRESEVDMRLRGLASRRGLGFAGAALVMAVLVVAPAFACGATGGRIDVRPARGEAGTGVDVVGVGFEGQPGSATVDVRWGGANGQLLAQVTPDESGAFTQRITVPNAAQPGWHQVTATQKRAGFDTYSTSNYAFEVTGVVTPAPAPVVTQPSPAPQPTPVPQPTATAEVPAAAAAPAPAPAPTAAQATASQPAGTRAAATPAPPAPAPPTPAPAPPLQAPPAAGPPSGTPERLNLSEIRETDPAGLHAAPIEPLLLSDPAAMGGPRTIDSGPPVWLLVPLVLAGLTLFGASCAVVVTEVRHRRVRAKVKA